MVSKEKKSFKDIAIAEIRREPDALDRLLAGTQVVAAFGRRQFDKSEIMDDEGEDEEEEEDVGDPDDPQADLKRKVKAAKPKYLEMFKKEAPKTEAELKQEAEAKEKRKDEERKTAQSYGLWDDVKNKKMLPKLAKGVKKEWVPPDWEQMLAKLKEEGRDISAIDNDLKDINKVGKEVGRTKTGKYLMPDDLRWCRKSTKFGEKDVLKWFRKFRGGCSQKGEIGKEAFKGLFLSAFPLGDADIFADAIFEVFEMETREEEGLDFKVRGFLFLYCVLGTVISASKRLGCFISNGFYGTNLSEPMSSEQYPTTIEI